MVAGSNTANLEGKGTSSNVGGIVGRYESMGEGGTVIKTFGNTGTIKGFQAGGIVGYISSSSEINITNGNASGDANGVEGGTSGSVTGMEVGSQVGGLIGYASMGGSFNNIFTSGAQLKNNGAVSASANGANYAGGIVGMLESGVIVNAVNNGAVTSSTNGSYVGGIAGYISSSAKISQATNNGAVTGTGSYANYVGGIVGYAKGDVDALTNVVSNTGTVKGNKYAGGIVGYLEDASIGVAAKNRIVNSGEVTSSPIGDLSYAGGVVAYVKSGDNTDVIIGKNTATVTSGAVSGSSNSASCSGGIVGYLGGTQYVAGDSSNRVGGTNSISSGGLVGYAHVALTVNAASSITGNVQSRKSSGGVVGYANAEVVIADSASISVGSAINAKNSETSDSNMPVSGAIAGRLNSSITIDATVSMTSGSIISNNSGSSRNGYAGGLCGMLATTATIKQSFNFSGIIIEAKTCGGVVGKLASGEIIAPSQAVISVTLTMKGDSLGGIAGIVESGKIENIKTTGIVTIDSAVTPDVFGGITGISKASTIKSCENSAKVSGSISDSVGGIIGETSGSTASTIEGCINSADIGSATISNVGGIIGCVKGSKATLKGCSNTGAIIASSCAGGLIGKSDSQEVAISANGSTQSSNGGNIQTAGDYAGGFIGYVNKKITIEGSSSISAGNNGTVRSKQYTGGFIGYSSSSDGATVKYCINTGIITTSSDYDDVRSGGIIGYAKKATVTYSENSGAVTATNVLDPMADAYAGGIIGYGGSDGFTGGSSSAPLMNSGSVSAQVDISGFHDDLTATPTGGKWGNLNALGVKAAGLSTEDFVLAVDYYKSDYVWPPDYSGYAGGIVGYSDSGTAYGNNTGTIKGTTLKYVHRFWMGKESWSMNSDCNASAVWVEYSGYVAGGGSITVHAKGDSLINVSDYALPSSPDKEGECYAIIDTVIGAIPKKGGKYEKTGSADNSLWGGWTAIDFQQTAAAWAVAWCAKKLYVGN